MEIACTILFYYIFPIFVFNLLWLSIEMRVLFQPLTIEAGVKGGEIQSNSNITIKAFRNEFVRFFKFGIWLGKILN